VTTKNTKPTPRALRTPDTTAKENAMQREYKTNNIKIRLRDSHVKSNLFQHFSNTTVRQLAMLNHEASQWSLASW
jgi:hypothetical protein